MRENSFISASLFFIFFFNKIYIISLLYSYRGGGGGGGDIEHATTALVTGDSMGRGIEGWVNGLAGRREPEIII